jgi:hypothetical protein
LCYCPQLLHSFQKSVKYHNRNEKTT